MIKPRLKTSEREIDAQIAEKIMGYQWWRSATTGERGLFKDRKEHWFVYLADMTEQLCVGWDTQVPHYSSTDYQDVINEMLFKGFSFCSWGIPGQGFCAGFAKGSVAPEKICYSRYLTIVEGAETMGVAICLAALDAWAVSQKSGA